MFSFILAAAATVATVQVAPADRSAQFMENGSWLKFDPLCRDYDVETVKTNPDCAARVERGEAGPTIAIATWTFLSLPARGGEAVRLLEHSAEVTDSPAVHYLLGTALGTAERHQPNFALAIRHLDIASRRGNPAAADLLANLIMAGKGGPRDVARAIELYTNAAANGFPTAAIALAKLYLAGKFVPKNEAKGLAWLDAAAAVDVPGATQLAALARNHEKVSNFQLLPSPDPAKVRVVRYGTFDNPDIPPNFGFDPEFQAVHDAPYDDADVLVRLKNGAGNLPTPYLYELARRLAATEPRAALQTYLLAKTRMTYDASRCADPAALEGLRAWDMLVARDMRFLFASGGSSSTEASGALIDEAKLASDAEPWWICRSGMAAMSAAMGGKSVPLKLKPVSEWPELRKAARARLQALAGAPR